MVNYAEIAQKIIDAHPTSVHQLLKGKGITKPATPEVLKDAYILFGKPFISELVDIIYLPKRSKYSDYLPAVGMLPYNYALQTVKPVSIANTPAATLPTDQAQTLEAAVTSGTEKKSIWDSLSNIFDSVVKVATKISTVTGTVASTAQTAKDIVSPANGQPNIFQTEEKKALEEAENKKFTKTLLIVSAIIILVLITLIIITRKK